MDLESKAYMNRIAQEVRYKKTYAEKNQHIAAQTGKFNKASHISLIVSFSQMSVRRSLRYLLLSLISSSSGKCQKKILHIDKKHFAN